MSPQLMDTEPGGEQTQYEGIDTYQKPHAKQGGQLGNDESQTEASAADLSAKAARGEKTADNIRYGQQISEEGVGGKTTQSEGSANQGSGYGSTSADTDTADAQQTRSSQGYGGGSGIGG